MSDDTPPTSEKLPAAAEPIALRREALLPSERSRGLGTVAVVCTMAGVASGLALATTLMAMQVADTMSTRSACAYRQPAMLAPIEQDHGFLGIRYVFRDNAAQIDSVIPDTPAAQIGLRKGDRVIAVDHDRVDSGDELQERIFNARPGTRPLLMVQRGNEILELRPTLISWPSY
jgi:S1-C subfamily serine protease